MMVKAMAAAMVATTAATAMAGGTDNNKLKGAWKNQRGGDGKATETAAATETVTLTAIMKMPTTMLMTVHRRQQQG
jgi:hypothetical protein